MTSTKSSTRARPRNTRRTTFRARSTVPVLDDEERARVGTLYTQVSPFDAKKLGAALVSRNIARHIETRFAAHGRDWRPLVYCWRGGKRSAAMAHVLREIGWNAAQLEGGYKSYRSEVIAQLETLPAPLRLPRGVRRHRVGQEPAARAAGPSRGAGARPGGPRPPPRLGAGQPAGRPAAAAAAVRQHAVERAAAVRCVAAGIRRGRKQEDRTAAGSRRRCSSACARDAASWCRRRSPSACGS